MANGVMQTLEDALPTWGRSQVVQLLIMLRQPFPHTAIRPGGVNLRFEPRIRGQGDASMRGLAEGLALVGSLATAIGVLLAWWQIRVAGRQSATAFEDALAREYRDLAQRIPVSALLGDVLSAEEIQDNLDDFYSYVDLSNEQTYLRQKGRLRRDTWTNWCEGIRSNLTRPAFQTAWQLIKEKAPESFDELRRLESEGFETDPRDWS